MSRNDTYDPLRYYSAASGAKTVVLSFPEIERIKKTSAIAQKYRLVV